MQETILSVENLNTSFDTENGSVQILSNVSFNLKRGQTLSIVGESGCGKSVTSLSIMRLLPRPSGVIKSGKITFEGQDLLQLNPYEMHNIRGKKISMIFQEPMTALNPVKKIGKQIAEIYELHFPEYNKKVILKKSIELLKEVGIPLPEKRLNEYPHQLSGGMRQRVMIAMALACKPDIIIADEPTTALDVTIQAQILRLLKKLQKEYNTSIIFITHDLGVVAKISDEVIVMYCGEVVEKNKVDELFKNPKHPYTKGLLSSIPRLENTPKSHLQTIEGMVPPLSNLPAGCRFQNRCPYVEDKCKKQTITPENLSDDHFVRCLKWNEHE